jgi:hypothetical protein
VVSRTAIFNVSAPVVEAGCGRQAPEDAGHDGDDGGGGGAAGDGAGPRVAEEERELHHAGRHEELRHGGNRGTEGGREEHLPAQVQAASEQQYDQGDQSGQPGQPPPGKADEERDHGKDLRRQELLVVTAVAAGGGQTKKIRRQTTCRTASFRYQTKCTYPQLQCMFAILIDSR